VAGEVLRRLKLDAIWFLVAGQPWMKSDRPVTEAAHRVRMLRLALHGRKNFRVSTLEVERSGPTYTVETMANLRAKYPVDEFYFIIGRGTFARLPQWRKPRDLISLCRLVVVPRPGVLEPDVKAMEKEIPGLSQRVIFLDKPLVDISATGIRQRVARGEDISKLVPAAVARYINKYRLYQERDV
jgi:nicotinate-nucleotide adenylyltransferase